jgi:hypothetical protein
VENLEQQIKKEKELNQSCLKNRYIVLLSS